MESSVQEHRLHAAGGGLPALSRAWLWFHIRPLMDGRTVLKPWRRQFRDQQQLLLVAEVARMQSLNPRSGGKKRMRRVLG